MEKANCYLFHVSPLEGKRQMQYIFCLLSKEGVALLIQSFDSDKKKKSPINYYDSNDLPPGAMWSCLSVSRWHVSMSSRVDEQWEVALSSWCGGGDRAVTGCQIWKGTIERDSEISFSTRRLCSVFRGHRLHTHTNCTGQSFGILILFLSWETNSESLKTQMACLHSRNM